MKKLDINKDYNNGGSLYLEDGYLYKVYDEISYFRDEKERNIKFLMNNSIPNTPKIYKMLYKNNEFNGYVMEYIEEAMTFRDGMKQEISFSDKIKAILDVYETLKVLHGYNICIGDIHLSNFLYKNGHGYVIDLDEIRYPEDNFRFRERYLVKESIKSVPSKQASFITDNIKFCICCLSFLYNIDLENIICKYSLKSVKMILKFLTSDEEYKEISKVLDVNKLYYFDDVLVNRVNKSRVLKR